MGLLLGASVITLCEVLDLVLNKLMVNRILISIVKQVPGVSEYWFWHLEDYIQSDHVEF